QDGRMSRTKGDTLSFAILALFPCSFAAVFFYFAWRETAPALRLIGERTAKTTGMVVAHDRKVPGGRYGRARVRYDVAGTVFETTGPGEGRKQIFPDGSVVPILYRVERPTESVVSGFYGLVFPILPYVVGGFGGALFGSLLLGQVWRGVRGVEEETA